MKFLLALHFLVTLALVGVILLQKSGDTALGIGGNSSGGLLTARGQANLLTKMTSWLATIFILNCILMASISKPEHKHVSVIDQASQEQVVDAPITVDTTPPTADAKPEAPTAPKK
ncbi:MAG: preprotein translocase subunit SecG [Holosporales bacterium]|jgi:preprotein translocase subunit SecG|nr:preprotein translocase subunit SecG [Holosporales bacterium]